MALHSWSTGDSIDADDLNNSFSECGPFGAWESKSANTVYQAATDGFVICYFNGVDHKGINTDGSDPPTTKRVYVRPTDGYNFIPAICPVRRGDYWKASDGASSVYWLPIGQ